MTRALACLAVLLLAACPERKHPERGTQLVYAKAGDVGPREAIERRLARAGLVAKLSEDDTRLTVRITAGGDVAGVKALIGIPGKLELCAADASTARAWCTRAATAGVDAQPYGASDLCRLSAADEKTLKAAVGDATVRYERGSGEVLAHAVVSDCFTPRLTAGERKGDQRLSGRFPVNVTFDGESARELEALTRRSLFKPLIVSLDGEALFAPIVQDAITGGKLMLALPGRTPADVDRLLTAIVGGPVEGLTLEKEAAYGPPSLR